MHIFGTLVGGWSRSKNGCLGGGEGSLQVLAIHGDNHLEVLLTKTLLQVCKTLQALKKVLVNVPLQCAAVAQYRSINQIERFINQTVQ